MPHLLLESGSKGLPVINSLCLVLSQLSMSILCIFREALLFMSVLLSSKSFFSLSSSSSYWVKSDLWLRLSTLWDSGSMSVMSHSISLQPSTNSLPWRSSLIWFAPMASFSWPAGLMISSVSLSFSYSYQSPGYLMKLRFEPTLQTKFPRFKVSSSSPIPSLNLNPSTSLTYR